jgi:hypothetical protein
VPINEQHDRRVSGLPPIRSSEGAAGQRRHSLPRNRNGKLRAFRVGGQWRILGSDLMSYLNSETESAMNKRSD